MRLEPPMIKTLSCRARNSGSTPKGIGLPIFYTMRVCLAIDMLVDAVAVLASRHTFALVNAIQFLAILPRARIPRAHRAILRRFMARTHLGALGQLDLLALVSPSTEFELNRIALGACAQGHIPILTWVYGVHPRCSVFLPPPQSFLDEDTLFSEFLATAFSHHQLGVLDWLSATLGAEVLAPFAPLMAQCATQCFDVPALKWIRRQPHISPLTFDFAALPQSTQCTTTTAGAIVATLEWWKAEHASRGQLLVEIGADPFEAALGMCEVPGVDRVIEWWYAYYARHGLAWPACYQSDLTDMLRNGQCNQFIWWWATASPTSPWLVIDTQVVQLMCDYGTVELLDWWWALDSAANKKTWRPRECFTRAPIAEWWYQKALAGLCDMAVLEIRPELAGVSKFECLVNRIGGPPADLSALKWWWQENHRTILGLELALSERALFKLVRWGWADCIRWYFESVCSESARIPDISARIVLALICDREPRLDLVEWLWQLHIDHNVPFPLPATAKTIIDVFSSENGSASVALDYLWDLHARAGVPFQAATATASCVHAWRLLHFDQVDWWYAMHRVHGYVFPTAAELRNEIVADQGQAASEAWLDRHFYISQ
ncbi:hypothetical protein BC828DRAFT_376678 [Blastocladiella britannica]|nr:hypothetical protein BC828DRAFT_376678 [Blastocladiella britannica]